MVLQCFTTHFSFLSLLPNNNNNHLRSHNNNNARVALSEERRDFSCCSLNPTTSQTRRDLLFLIGGGITSLSLTSTTSFPQFSLALAGEDPKMDSFSDEVNAYSYLYPLQLPSKKSPLNWVESRKPERYSSAAPLSPNARLRIVSERVDIKDNLIISVTIGPPNSNLIKLKDKSQWTAKDVADSVLADKSSLRVTSSQRRAESSVLDTHTGEIDGELYWYYEFLIRKSPTGMSEESGVFRHYVASTAERDGFLYSISASTLSPHWNEMGPLLEKTVSSFRLVSPTENYVSPSKDPWRFW